MSYSPRQLTTGVPFLLTVLFAGRLFAAPGPVTIVDTATGCDATTERTNLTAALVSAGNTVTTIMTGVVPSDLTGQQQVWDIRCQNVLTAPEIATYTSYLAGGGSLFLMGENTGFGASRDASLISFIGTMGGGSLTLTATASAPTPQTVQPPFTGPDPLSTVVFRAVAGTTTSGTGSFVTRDSNGHGGAIAFSPGSLSAAPSGTLIIVWDVNFLDSAPAHTAEETALTNNLIAYLATPAPIAPTVPAPPAAVLVLVGGAVAALHRFRRRTGKAA